MRHGRWLLGVAFFGLLAGCAEDAEQDDECTDESGYPSAPAGATLVQFVCSGAPDAGADGSLDHPYPRLQAAIDKAAPGSALRIRAGTYTENLQITKPLSIVGAEEDSGADAAAIIVQAPEPLAVNVLGAEGVLLRGLKILAPLEVGIRVREKSTVTVEACSVEGAQATERGFGYGIVAGDASSIIVQRTAVTGSADIGILLSQSRGIIVQSAVRESEGGGIRVDRADGETEVRENEIADNARFGVGVFGAKALIAQNQITDTRTDARDIGDGIVAAGLQIEGQPLQAAEVTVEGNEIARNARVGVLLSSAGGTLMRNQLRAHATEASFGAGIWLQGVAGGTGGVLIARNGLTDNRCVGIGATGRSRAIIVQNTVAGTAVCTTFQGVRQVEMGDGIGLFDGAVGHVVANILERNGRLGVVLDAAAAESTLRENVIKDSGLFGIIVQNQPQAPDLQGNTVTGSRIGDIRVAGPGASIVQTRSDAFSTQAQ